MKLLLSTLLSCISLFLYAQDEEVSLAANSPLSFWAGSSMSYSFEGEGSDNFIGGGQIQLESFKRFQKNDTFKLLIVGNLSKIASSLSEDDPTDDITELVMSEQGLCLGIAPIVQLFRRPVPDENGDVVRLYSNISYKVNGFQDVGPEKETVNLDQFRVSLGLEFEGLEVSSGAPINISSEVVYSSFSGDKYERVFGERQSSFVAIESQLIIPIGQRTGFLIKHTHSNKAKSVMQVGLILSSSHKKMSTT